MLSSLCFIFNGRLAPIGYFRALRNTRVLPTRKFVYAHALVSLTKTHKFHSTIVIAHERFRSQWGGDDDIDRRPNYINNIIRIDTPVASYIYTHYTYLYIPINNSDQILSVMEAVVKSQKCSTRFDEYDRR